MVVIHPMELSAFKVENVEAVFVITSNASHHQLLDQVEKTLSVVRTLIVSQTNSVTQDSALTSAWDSSFLNVPKIFNVAMQVSAMMSSSVKHTQLLGQVERTLFALLTLTASRSSSAMQDSAQYTQEID